MQAFITTLCTLGLFSWLLCSNGQKTKYFEGEVVYEIEYRDANDSLNERNFGDHSFVKTILRFKRGNYIKRHFSATGKLMSEVSLDMKTGWETGIEYATNRAYKRNIFNESKQKTPAVIFKADSTVGKFKCKILELDQKEIYTRIAYAKELAVNPYWYIDCKYQPAIDYMSDGMGIIAEHYSGVRGKEMRLMKIRSVKRRKVGDKELVINIPEGVNIMELK